MTLFDVSLPIHDGMLHWPSDPPVSIQSAKTLAEHGSNVEQLQSSTHLGTHIDAPRHFADDGRGVDAYPLEQLIGPAEVLDLTTIPGTLIEPEHLAGRLGAPRLLLKTRNTTERLLEQPFSENYVALSGDAAEYLAAQKVVVVGIDYLSIQQRGSDRRAHTALLNAGIAIIEGLWLPDVPAGAYQLYALPLRISSGSGAPARVVLEQV